MDAAPTPEEPGAVSALPDKQQAQRLGVLYTDAINGWGQCEKKRASLIDWIMKE